MKNTIEFPFSNSENKIKDNFPNAAGAIWAVIVWQLVGFTTTNAISAYHH
jgi:hypothetical protein